MSYSFKRILLTEILKIKRHLLPCHSKISFVLEKKDRYMCDQIMSALTQLHWDAWNEKIPFLNPQCSQARRGCYWVCPCFVLQGCWLYASEEGARVDKKSVHFGWAGEHPRVSMTLWLSTKQLCTRKWKNRCFIILATSAELLVPMSIYRVTMTSPGLNRL